MFIIIWTILLEFCKKVIPFISAINVIYLQEMLRWDKQVCRILKYIRAIGYFDSVKLLSYKVRAHTASSSLPFIKIIFS